MKDAAALHLDEGAEVRFKCQERVFTLNRKPRYENVPDGGSVIYFWLNEDSRN